jgi:hypothetical protein
LRQQRFAIGAATVIQIATQSCKIVSPQEMPTARQATERHMSSASYRSIHVGDGPQFVAGLTPISPHCF